MAVRLIFLQVSTPPLFLADGNSPSHIRSLTTSLNCKRNAKTAASQRNSWVSCPPPKRLSMPLKCQMPSRVLIPRRRCPKTLWFFFVFFPRPLFFLSSISQGYASKLASRASRSKHRVLSCRDRLLRWKGRSSGSRRRVLVFFGGDRKSIVMPPFPPPPKFGISQNCECGSYVAEHHRTLVRRVAAKASAKSKNAKIY